MPKRMSFVTPITKPLADAHVLDGGGWWRVAVMKADPKRGEVHVYGQIGMDFFGEGVDPSALIDELEALDVAEIDVRINSPGGSAWDGLNIANAMMRHKATITTYVDGLAASAASMLMVAGDKVVTSKYGSAMLHNARLGVIGGADDLRAAASQLDKLNGSIAMLYADRAGGTAPDWARAMKRETWYNADEMVAAGLAHEIDDSTVRDVTEGAVACAMSLAPSDWFKYAGRGAAPAPTARATREETAVADKKDLAKSLGLPEDATDEDIKTAVDAALGVTPAAPPEGGSPDPADPPAAPVADPAPEPVGAGAPSAKVRDGVVELDEETYKQLRAGAEAGAKAQATLTAQAHASIVDAAIDEGRIMPSRREHYIALMAADPTDTTDLLQKRLEKGAAVPINELGHAQEPAPTDRVEDDPRFTEWKVG